MWAGWQPADRLSIGPSWRSKDPPACSTAASRGVSEIAPCGRGSEKAIAEEGERWITCPGCARMDRYTIGPQVGNLPHNC
jgi:hypothetical protein